MRKMLFLSLFFLLACNPEHQKVGSSPNDLVKYFKIGAGGVGEGFLVVAHAGNTRILTFFLKTQTGFSHTDVVLSAEGGSFKVQSLYSQTPECQLTPDAYQDNYLEYLNIKGEKKALNLEILDRTEATKTSKTLGC